MAATDTFHCKIITPEQTVFDGPVSSAVFTAHDGQRGVLRNHAPFTAKLGIGHVRVETPDGRHMFFIDGGFTQVVDNDLTILAERAKPQADIDRAAAEHALRDAIAMGGTDDAALTAKARAVACAKAQLDLTDAS